MACKQESHGPCQPGIFAQPREINRADGLRHKIFFNFAFLAANFSHLSKTESMKPRQLQPVLLAFNMLFTRIIIPESHRQTGGAIINIPIQITFKNMLPSEAVEAHIRERAEKLDSFYEKIMGCRVLVEAPHHHHRAGQPYHVRIDLTVPGGELVIKREPRLVTEKPLHDQKNLDDVELEESRELSKYAVHDDISLVIRDAFDAARRKLQDYARRERGAVKAHEGLPHARVAKLFPEEGFGFLETPDGREIYFHENSVLEPGFNRLKLGAEVHFLEEAGEKGPQASTVRPVKHHGR